jgi:hydroxyacylglutathione hydrolase
MSNDARGPFACTQVRQPVSPENGRPMRVETFTLGELRENAYLVFADEARGEERRDPLAGEDAVVAIDPGDEPVRLIERIEQSGARLLGILLTHAHWDHVGGVRDLKAAFDSPVYLHEADAPLYARVVEQAALFGFHAEPQPPVDHTVKHGDVIELGPFRFDVIHTPGHSPGGVCYRLHGPTTGLDASDELSPKGDAPTTRGPHAAGQSDVVFVGDTIFAGSVGRCDLPGGSFEQLISGIRQRILTLDDATVLYPGHGPATTVAAERAANPFL